MNSILEAVLAATITPARRSEAVVVSEVNDVNAITIEAAAVDAAIAGMTRGVWDAAEYGISLAEAQARIQEANTPEARARVLADLRQRAIRRASLDTTNGKVAVMVAGKPAWHGLGVNVSAAVSAADAIRLAGLDWSVSKRAMSFRRADGTYTESDDTYAIVRDDSEVQLGTVGSRYQIIQNDDGFRFLDSVIGEYGARFHTAGACHGGTKVWMQCELPAHSFHVTRNDEVQAFATFTNVHDGTGKAWCFPTTNRVVCANTFRTASKDRATGLGIRHTGNVNASIADARRCLGIAVQEIDTFRQNADVMARTAVNPTDYFHDVLDAVCEVTAADAMMGADALAAILRADEAGRDLERKRIQREIDRRNAMLEEILTRYESDRCGVDGIRGTQWAAFNAVTEFADHRKPGRRVGTPEAQASRRFESVIAGEADEIKQTAYSILTRA